MADRDPEEQFQIIRQEVQDVVSRFLGQFPVFIARIEDAGNDDQVIRLRDEFDSVLRELCARFSILPQDGDPLRRVQEGAWVVASSGLNRFFVVGGHSIRTSRLEIDRPNITMSLMMQDMYRFPCWARYVRTMGAFVEAAAATKLSLHEDRPAH